MEVLNSNVGPSTAPLGDRWAPAAMEPWQQKGDELADSTIAHLLQTGQIDGVYRILDAIQFNGDAIPADCPAILRDFLQETQSLPDFARPELLEQSHEVFSQYGLPMLLSLFCLVLPEGYAAPRPALALSFTRTMYEHTRRRLAETAQFLLDVVSPGAFSARGKAIRTTQKVRLMHAAARYFVKRKAEWPAHYGDPISQEDLAAVAGGFGSETIRGLEKLGIVLREPDREAYVHCWSVMSHFIGLEPELIAQDFQDMDLCVQAYKRRQWGASKEGKELTASMMDMVNRQLPPPLRGLPEAYLYYLIGPEGAKILGVRKNLHNRLLRPFVGLNSFVNLSQHKSRRLTRLVRSLTLGILQGIMVREMDGRPARFHMQPALRKRWQLEPVYRRFSRLQKLDHLDARLMLTGSDKGVAAKVFDLSRTGACFRLPTEFPPNLIGTSIQACLSDGVRDIMLRMICCNLRSGPEDSYLGGFEFVEPERWQVRTIQDWLTPAK